MKKFSYMGKASTGSINFDFYHGYEQDKDCGNEAEFIIECTEGQFEGAEFTFLRDGFKIRIFGSCEMAEFLAAFADIARRLNVNRDEWIEKTDHHKDTDSDKKDKQ